MQPQSRRRTRVALLSPIFFGLLVLALPLVAGQSNAGSESSGPTQYDDLKTTYLKDNSDWWSEIAKGEGGEPPGDISRASPSPHNFEILGISVWGFDLHWPNPATRVLGRATVVERGDASGGRSQVCYDSVPRSEATKLIFETGECANSFYLFDGGQPFSGTDRCQSSKLVTNDLKTTSGLGLGMTREEIRKILGPPVVVHGDSFTYKYNVIFKRTKEELEEWKRLDGEMPDAQFDEGLSIVIKFRGERSWFLYVASSIC